MKKMTIALLACLGLSVAQGQKFDGLALTPPMGWNSWNTFQTKINEDLVKQTADILVNTGMRDAGYRYIVLDDGWMSMERDSVSGDLVPDPVKFPHGMRALVDYVHSRGLKFGLYNCAGTKTCAGYPGTRGYEYQDARFYASLDIDYLKFDWCNTDGINAIEAYTTMSKALKAAKRPIIFSLCEWGTNRPWLWAEKLGQLWRTTGDIANLFDGIKDYGNWHANGVMTIVDMQDSLRKYAGPGHWNDPDMLEVGNGMRASEDRVHFSIWCMLAAPLMLGNDLRSMSSETRTLLTNREIIAIDQDPLGIQGFRYANRDSLQTWLKPLKGGGWAICFINRSQQTKDLQIDWSQWSMVDELSGERLEPAKTSYIVRDIWQGKELGNTGRPFKASLAGHDAIVLRLSK